MKSIMQKDNTVLVLKTVSADMSDHCHSFFTYPRQGMVSCPVLNSGSAFVFNGLVRGTGDGYNLSTPSDIALLLATLGRMGFFPILSTMWSTVS